MTAVSLGLVGDGDEIDVVRDVEEAFGLRLPDGDLSRVRTVGDLFALLPRLPVGGAGAHGCASAMAFWRLRRAAMAAGAGRIAPGTPMVVVRAVSARRLARLIEAEGLRPPVLEWTRFGCLAMVAALATFPALLLVGRALPRRLPRTLKTAGELARNLARRKVGALGAAGARLGEREAWAALRVIVAEGCAVETYMIAPETLLLAPPRR